MHASRALVTGVWWVSAVYSSVPGDYVAAPRAPTWGCQGHLGGASARAVCMGIRGRWGTVYYHIVWVAGMHCSLPLGGISVDGDIGAASKAAGLHYDII